jgi:hypothetical protein
MIKRRMTPGPDYAQRFLGLKLLETKGLDGLVHQRVKPASSFCPAASGLQLVPSPDGVLEDSAGFRSAIVG